MAFKNQWGKDVWFDKRFYDDQFSTWQEKIYSPKPHLKIELILQMD